MTAKRKVAEGLMIDHNIPPTIEANKVAILVKV